MSLRWISEATTTSSTLQDEAELLAAKDGDLMPDVDDPSDLSSASDLGCAGGRRPFWVVPLSNAAEFSDDDESSGSEGSLSDLPEEEEEEEEPVSGRVKELCRESATPVPVLNELETEGLLGKIPRDLQGKLTSVGSIAHASGSCSPCIFAHRGCCSKLLACSFCHFGHAVKSKASVLRKKRQGAARSRASAPAAQSPAPAAPPTASRSGGAVAATAA